ncbi:FAD-binding oxidoreductase [Jatrophihabitans endophyticus]|uniref:FAD-binding oxidoreductase n=1 Tax=Jatrophihabitans endophyticus TaxID=1206085 RepID=UPI001A010BBB|nr:FAD-binding oxidoreductase [Jatrophihabitans endophyticus]
MHTVGRAAHERAVDTLRRSYRAIPPGRTVRLAKRTSNLFRVRDRAVAGLDVAALSGVVSIDLAARTADVQGMCTYETLVDATLAHGLMPAVVPQLRTITLGGAVTGLGVESSSLRCGLPHESVLEMDVLTGDGELVTASPGQNADLFAAFPNSYGSLGYAVRLRIALEPVRPFVDLRHLRFDDLDELAATIEAIAADGAHDGDPVDFVDGVMFSPTEAYLTLARWSDTCTTPSGTPSDYTGRQIYYRSLQQRDRDCLTVYDYLWRWDTDWFWCSGAFGVQNPVVRRLWPRRWRRSDVYHRLVGLDNRFDLVGRIDRRRGLPPRERVVQDVEVPLARTAEFLRWFDDHVPMSPVWLCPLRATRAWPLYPLEPGSVYVNVGFWGTVPIVDGRDDGDVNRSIEGAVARMDGHKSLYSDVYYDRATFDDLYGGVELKAVRERYDPQGRLTGMFEKVVQSS